MAPKLHVKKGDKVEVISGKDKGKTGKILKSFPSESKVLVEGINMVKRHTKPNKQDKTGGIVEQEAKTQASNVLLYCPKCKRGVRTGSRIENDKKVRFCKKCDKSID